VIAPRRRRGRAVEAVGVAIADSAGGSQATRPAQFAGVALPSSSPWSKIGSMCRNITTLRGLEPPATTEEIEAAARQYVRKVSGITHPTAATDEAFEQAVAMVARVTAEVLHDLPPRRQPPRTVPPLRRPEVRARMT
jgi:hypothetical protein